MGSPFSEFSRPQVRTGTAPDQLPCALAHLPALVWRRGDPSAGGRFERALQPAIPQPAVKRHVGIARFHAEMKNVAVDADVFGRAGMHLAVIAFELELTDPCVASLDDGELDRSRWTVRLQAACPAPAESAQRGIGRFLLAGVEHG